MSRNSNIQRHRPISATALGKRVQSSTEVLNIEACAAARRGVIEHADYEEKVAKHHSAESIPLQKLLRNILYFAAICAVLFIMHIQKL